METTAKIETSLSDKIGITGTVICALVGALWLLWHLFTTIVPGVWYYAVTMPNIVDRLESQSYGLPGGWKDTCETKEKNGFTTYYPCSKNWISAPITPR